MVSFIFSIILLLLAVGIFAAGRVVRKSRSASSGANPRWFGFAGGVLAFVALAILAFSIFTIVPTKQVGVPVTFGKPGQPMSNGLHAKAPWTDIVLMDATTQSLDASGDNPTIAKDVDKADVFVHNNVRWSINEEAAASLYVDYKDFEGVNDALIQPQLRTAIASVMTNYDPLKTDNPSYEKLAEDVKTKLQAAVGDRVTIHSVSITLLDFSDATKSRINALNTERGNTRIAEQKKITAAAEAEANRIIADSVSKDPNVLVSKCLDLVNEGKPIPAGFQCWPGQSEGTNVIVDGKAAQPAR